MSRTLIVALVLAASATAASAAPYLGLGVGSSADLNGKLPQFSDDGRSYRLFGGYRFVKYLSIEGAITRFGEVNHEIVPYEATSAALVAKGSLPLGSGFEAYARLGLQHTWLSTDQQNYNSYDGTGYLLGAGFEYRFHTPIGGASVFVDYSGSTPAWPVRTSRMTRAPACGRSASRSRCSCRRLPVRGARTRDRQATTLPDSRSQPALAGARARK